MSFSIHPTVFKYRFELMLISVSVVTAIAAGLLSLPGGQLQTEPVGIDTISTGSAVLGSSNNAIRDNSRASDTYSRYVYIEVSGAVKTPGVFKLAATSRLQDAIQAADGLNDSADAEFVARNINRAQFVSDQEKIHIPSRSEVAQGIFLEKPTYLEYLGPVEGTKESQVSEGPSITKPKGSTSLNSATLNELDQLPGVGKTTALKIIDNRPYQSTAELVERKILSQKVFDSLSSQIQP